MTTHGRQHTSRQCPLSPFDLSLGLEYVLTWSKTCSCTLLLRQLREGADLASGLLAKNLDFNESQRSASPLSLEAPIFGCVEVLHTLLDCGGLLPNIANGLKARVAQLRRTLLRKMRSVFRISVCVCESTLVLSKQHTMQNLQVRRRRADNQAEHVKLESLVDMVEQVGCPEAMELRMLCHSSHTSLNQ